MRDVNLLSPEFQDDPFPTLAERRAAQPAFQASDFPAWILTRHEDVMGMRDESAYSVAHVRMLREPIDGPNMIQMDGEEHHRNRSLVAPSFRPRVLERFAAETIEPLVAWMLDGLRVRGEAELMREFCEPLPFHTIAELLGLDVADQPRLSRLYKEAIAANPVESDAEQLEQSLGARKELDEMLIPVVEDRRRSPGEDFVSQLVTATSRDGDRLDEEHVLGFLRFMLPAGEESTMSALGTLVLELLRHPDQLEALRADPALVVTAVEEALRWRAPIAYLNRTTTRDVVVGDVTVPAGSLVLGAINGANRDPVVFDAPDSFRIDRAPNKHVAFGAGVHMCIGAPIARLELQVALRGVLERLPNLRLQDGFEPRYEGLFSNALTELPVEWDA